MLKLNYLHTQCALNNLYLKPFYQPSSTSAKSINKCNHARAPTGQEKKMLIYRARIQQSMNCNTEEEVLQLGVVSFRVRKQMS